MESIAFIIAEYLGLPETFIYEEIVNLKRFRPVVLTHSVINTDMFPLETIIKLREGLWKLTPDYGESRGVIGGVKNFKHYLQAIHYFKRLIRKENVRIVHAQYGSDGVYSIPFKERFGLPLVTSFRGYDASKAPLENPGIYDKLFDVGDIFLVRSNSMKEDLIKLGCPKKKIRVHHSSIDLNKFRYVEREPPESKSPVKLLYVGRLVEKKGILNAIKAFHLVLRDRPNTLLSVVGDGPLRDEAHHLAESLGVADNITFKGFLAPDAIPREMVENHIFMLPCKTSKDGDKEGIPNSIKEAQASGMPVVSTLHSGVPEAVLNGKTGYLVEEGDTTALYERLIHLIDHPELWPEFGKAGRKHMENEFNIKNQTEKLESLYASILS